MEQSPLHDILNPKSIAFMGGSNSIENMGTSQLLNIVKGGFKGKVYPVHPPVYPAPERAVRAMAALWRCKQIKDNFKLSGNTR